MSSGFFLLKKRLRWHRCFPVHFVKFLKVRNNFRKYIREIFRFKKGEGGTHDWEGWSEMEEAATGCLQLY